MKSLIRRSFALLFVLAAIVPAASLAQAPKGGKVAANKTAPKCSGAWTGNITYTRTHSMSDTKTTQRVSNRGKDTLNWQMNYNYKASVAVLESPERDGSYVGKANIDHKMTSVEKTQAREENSCDRGKTWQVMSGDFESLSETRGQASNVEARVSVGVNTDGTYSVSVGIPQIKGLVEGKETASFSGQCTKKEGKSTTMPSSPVSIDGHTLSTDGRHRVDPKDPDNLSGSFTQQFPGGVSETISWSLQRCGGKLRITDIKFEEMKFPNWNDWHEISEQKGTIDGNFLKIKAKVLNESGETKYADVRFKETYKGDKWDGARPDAPLKDDVISVRVDANSEETVELMWDSSGYAWFDDGRPRLVQRIKAELEENSKKIDEMTKNLKVAPKPLVLVHGLWSNWRAWEAWQNILTTSHSYDWKAFPVGEKPEKGVMNTGKSFMSSDQTASIGDNAYQLESYIKFAQEDRNAWHVDIVAHSMGGLISRWYIDQLMPATSPDGRPKVSNLLMLGTPNMGSPCADVMDIAFGMIGKQVEAIRQLQPAYLEGFNKIHTQRKGVKFSVLAGNPLPTMCKSVVWNDGVVPVPSAKWKIKDNAESKNLHTDLTGTADFSAFVKPRLAIGPKGDHNPEAPDQSQFTGRYTNSRVYGAQANDFDADLLAASSEPLTTQPFAKSITLAGKKTIEIDIPVAAANDLGITFMADPNVSVVLIDALGNVVGKNESGSPESRGLFRSIYFDKPVTAGTWRIRLLNTAEEKYDAILTTWNDAR